MMPWDAWFTLGMVALLVAALVSNRVGTDTAMLGVLTALMAVGILEPVEAVAGFADPSVLMIGALFVVASGLTATGATEMLARRVLGRPKGLGEAQLRLMAPVAAMSAFMNNTPIVAMYLPIVHGYARRIGASPSKLFMPLSFAAILGGACTLIGTSTNVVVNGLYLEYFAENAETLGREFGLVEPSTAKQFWWVAVVGAPSAVLGLGLIVVASRWLLPERRPPDSGNEDAKEYSTEVTVEEGGPLVGKTIEQAGLRQLPGLFLYAIERDGEEIPAVSPDERLEAGDRLVFAGVMDSVVDLLKIRGLAPAEGQAKKVDAPRGARRVVEAVVSHNSPLVGKSVRDAAFRTRFNAAIIAVHRGGQRIRGKIGDITLQAGDTLLLSTHDGFVRAFRNSRQFYMVSNLEESGEVRHERAWLAIAILLLLVALLTLPTGGVCSWANAAFGTSFPETGIPKLTAAFLCAVLMVLARCTTGTNARTTINWQVLLSIAGAIGVGKAMAKTGAAGAVADAFFAFVEPLGPRGVLLGFFLLTTLFCQLITNKGAAVLMFPVAVALTQRAGVSPEPFVVTLMAAAACSFLTPIGFVTNLMVYGPGGYRFADYLRLGLPLTILVGVIATVVTPVVFPFSP